MQEKPERLPKLLRFLLIGLFIYGSLSYSLSLLEYTLFQSQGVAVLGVSKVYPGMDVRQHSLLTEDCGSQLLPAAGVEPPAIGETVILRCGRFWPFYRYAVQAPQTRATLDLGDNNTGTIRWLNQVWMVLAIGVIALSAASLYQALARRRTATAYRWSGIAFVASLLMVGSYVAGMLWADPHFGLGW